MKNFKSLPAMAFCVIAVGLTSCENYDSNELKYLPFRSSEDGKWGMMTVDGKVIFEEEFKRKPTVPINGRFFVEDKEGNVEIYTIETIPQKVGNKYKEICPFTEKVTPAVERNQRIKLIDIDGKEVATLEKAGGKNIISATTFHEGLSIIGTEEGYGCIDTKGHVVIEPIYHHIEPCSDGIMLTVLNKNYDRNHSGLSMGYSIITAIDKKGKELFNIRDSKYEPTSDCFLYGRLPVCSEGEEERFGFINTKGEVIYKLTGKIGLIKAWDDKTFIYKHDDGWGLCNYDGETLIRPKYDLLDYAGNSLLWAGTEGKSIKLIDMDGKEVSTEEYKDMTMFSGQYAAVKPSKNEWTIIDKAGKEVKKLPDISEISYDDIAEEVFYNRIGEHWCKTVHSDFLDLDAIITEANITLDGCGAWTITQTPSQIIKVWEKENGNNTDVEPKNFMWTSNLSYKKEKEGVNIKYGVYYSGYMATSKSSYNEESWNYSTSYTWTTEKPKYISVIFSGDKLEGKTSLLFSKLLTKAKTFGKVYKTNKKTVLISIGNDSGLVLMDEDSDVRLMRFSNDSYKEFGEYIDEL